MAYTKTTWQNNVTDIDANNLNKIEQGIYDNSLVVDAVTNTLNPTDTETYKTAELTEGQITDVIGVNDILIKGQTSQNGEPTPSSPVDVNVVSGSNVIDMQNSNTNFAKDPVLIGYNLNNDGISIVPNFSVSQKIFINNNTNFYYGLIENFFVGDPNLRIGFFDENDNFLSRIVKNDISASSIKYVTIPSNAKYIRVGAKNELWNKINKVYYGFSNTIIPHQGKELPLDLGSIELCKIGDYQDYFYKSGSKWYLHKEIGKVVLNGTETWGGLTDLGDCIRVNTSFRCKYYQQLSDYFKYNDSYSLDEEHFYNYSNYFYVFLSKTKATTIEEFKTWLSNHNTTIYYVLETSTDTEITDTTLISQLEAIYNAPLYEQTNITQTNNDLPMILDITACKDNINGIKAFIRK